MTEERIEDCSEESAGRADGDEPPAVRAGADGDEGRDAYGEDLQCDSEKEVRVVRCAAVQASCQEGFSAEHAPSSSTDMQNTRGATGVSREGKAHQNEDDGRHAQGTECRKHRVGCAAGTAQALMDEREACGGERNQHDADQADGEVHRGPRWMER
jgi:hypothetical protein